MDMLTTIACNQVPLPITPDTDEQPLASATSGGLPHALSLSHSLSASGSHMELAPSTPSPRLNGVGSVPSGLCPPPALAPSLPLPPSAMAVAPGFGGAGAGPGSGAGAGAGGGGGLDSDAALVRVLQHRLSQHSRTGSLAEVGDECAPVHRSGGSTGTCPPNCSGCATHANSTFCKGSQCSHSSPFYITSTY